jgi:hypothetical protein
VADEDWNKKIDEARAKARRQADGKVDDDLAQITVQADQLRGIFDGLKLTDQATYDELIKIVEDATAENESVASVVDRLKTLGEAGVKLADSITSVASGGSLGVLRTALKLKS